MQGTVEEHVFYCVRYRLSVDDGQIQPRMEWLGPCDYTASLLLAANTEEEKPGGLEEAMAWLEEQLAGGPRWGAEIKRLAGLWRASARAPSAAPASGSVRGRSAEASPRRHTLTGSCDLPPPRG
jgi:hypothetical protein